MECRRCKKEFQGTDNNVCPFCGMRQDTHITPREPPVKSKRVKMSKTTKMSYLTLGVLLLAIGFIIPSLRNANRNNALKEINEIYLRNEPGDAEILSAKISQFKRSYPDNTDDIAEIESKLDAMLGLSNDAMTEEIKRQAEQREKEKNDALIATAKDTIIDVTNQTIDGPNSKNFTHYAITWKNTSKLEAQLIRLTIQGIDTDGNAVTGYGKKSANLYLQSSDTVAAGKSFTLNFLNLWKDVTIETVNLMEIEITYTDDSKVKLNRTVLQALYG